MCGIVGIAALGGAPPPEESQLRRMCRAIAHRGPDDETVQIIDGVGFGMRRLSVIDLAGGRQPIFNEDRSIRTIFNGEIYNYRELGRSLKRQGHKFHTASDTEVIVHAYEQYGRDFADQLNGMFAIALHDISGNSICLVRDPVGIKPLYYTLTGNYLIWGSEIKVLLASGLLEPQIDVDAFAQFLSWEYIPGAQTPLKGVHKLLPGTMLECRLDRVPAAPRRYWDIPLTAGQAARSDSEWESILDDKIKECVQRQVVSDVPLGAFLSGGVDSSTVVSAMGKPATTFSIGFDEQSYNELLYARAVANHLGVHHVDASASPEVLDLFDDLMYFLDDPLADSSIFPTFLVSRLASEHVTVALSGDGGDELFGGYETYVADALAKWYGRIPTVIRRAMIEAPVASLRPRPAKKGLVNKARRFVQGQRLPAGLGHARWRLFADDEQRLMLFTNQALELIRTAVEAHITDLFREAGERSPVDRNLYVDMRSYLCDNILAKVDRMSMAVSLETRVPLLDKELVELAFQVPNILKVHRGRTKILLKKVAACHVPAHCVYRPKEGFSMPIKNWLRGQFRGLLEELLDERRIREGGLLQAGTISRLKSEHLAGTADHSHVLWALIVFEAWRDKWLKNYSSVSAPGWTRCSPHRSPHFFCSGHKES
jgi:asparagine synthase (glutamine-hydrolysing)